MNKEGVKEREFTCEKNAAYKTCTESCGKCTECWEAEKVNMNSEKCRPCQACGLCMPILTRCNCEKLTKAAWCKKEEAQCYWKGVDAQKPLCGWKSETPQPTPAPTGAELKEFSDFGSFVAWCKEEGKLKERCVNATSCGKLKKGKNGKEDFCKWAKKDKKVKCVKIKYDNLCKAVPGCKWSGQGKKPC